jgi:FkbM family methyltransferase
MDVIRRTISVRQALKEKLALNEEIDRSTRKFESDENALQHLAPNRFQRFIVLKVKLLLYPTLTRLRSFMLEGGSIQHLNYKVDNISETLQEVKERSVTKLEVEQAFSFFSVIATRLDQISNQLQNVTMVSNLIETRLDKIVDDLQNVSQTSIGIETRVLDVVKNVDNFPMKMESIVENQLEKSSHSSTIENIEFLASRLLQRFVFQVSPTETIVRSNVGYIHALNSDLANIIQLIESGESELGTRLLIENELDEGDVFVDIGAHLGLHSIAASRKVGKQGAVIAFEPTPSTFRLLEKNLNLNLIFQNFTLIQKCVTDKSGPVKFYERKVPSHNSIHLNKSMVGEISISVPGTSLDDYFSKGFLINLLKIDAEGSEIEVIRGAQRLIAENSNLVIILEFGATHLQNRDISKVDWFRKVLPEGYRAGRISASALQVMEISEEDLNSLPDCNLIFAPTRSEIWKRY